jgi:biotin carboxyl carrier protein
MHYEVDVGARLRQITVALRQSSGQARAGDGFAVTVDGRPYHVDAARIDAQTLSLVVDTVLRRSYEVTVTPEPVTGLLTVTVAGVAVTVGVNGRRRWGRKDEAGASGSGPQRLAASMPGKVVRVLVKTGDAVRARQPLVVVEAMKMENEMRAGRDGTVGEVHAREGHSVEAGALLLVIQ